MTYKSVNLKKSIPYTRSSDLGCFLLTLISWVYSADTRLGDMFSILFYRNNDRRSYSDSRAVSACISQGEAHYTSKPGEITRSSVAWYQSPRFMRPLGALSTRFHRSGFSEYLRSAVLTPPLRGHPPLRLWVTADSWQLRLKNTWKLV